MPDNLHLTALRTQSLPFRLEEEIRKNVVSIANQTIVRAIKEEAEAKKMPERYIKNIKSEYDDEYLWIWVEFKGSNNEPLDEWFEEGTKRHFIKPNIKKALMWVQGGIRRFSKGHYVGGIEARHIFKNGFDKGYPEFLAKLKVQLEQYQKDTMLFG